MFDPMQAFLASEHSTIGKYDNLADEQYALRHGHVVRIAAPRRSLTVELGRLLIRTGERLTGECAHVELFRESV